jgi:hypothetical protein
MSPYKLIKSLPGQDDHLAFDIFPQKIYNANSLRFKLGHDPVLKHLEGCYLLYKNEEPVGRFSLYQNPDLKYQDEKTATIGSYECIEDLAVSIVLLDYAKSILQSKGYTYIIGPMEGSTWNNYRFSARNDTPNFFLEPFHHDYYISQFNNAGYQVIANYKSNIVDPSEFDTSNLDQIEKKFRDQGAIFRRIDLSDFKNELQKIAQLSIDGFSSNFLYTSLSVEDFVLKYEKLESFFDPELVWMAEDQKGEIHALIFCIKDYYDPTNNTLIVKSVVRKKSSPFRGIATYLSAKIVEMAKNGNYTKIIHALMIADNASHQISKKQTGQNYKNYSLFGLKI